ncbi:MAG: hypothetical protein GY750_11435 [Lentisphaerae bacterium]|nr:hypothetical protein [Lentisphaerota bacterium]MCP4102026.1 hypothetical protein [Lentisphaerota bacterium]
MVFEESIDELSADGKDEISEKIETMFVSSNKRSAVDMTITDLVVKLGKMFYTSNPFYLISAGLVLYASTIIFNTSNIWMETSVPVLMLSVYTLLLTFTSIFIVKAEQVWEDARSILFTILILFLALSTSMDEKAIDTTYAWGWLAGGLGFSVFILALLKFGLKIRLPVLMSSCYVAFLGLFFLYPSLQSHFLTNFEQKWVAHLGIVMFPMVAAIIMLPLLLVAARGRKCFKNNGTPWKWPVSHGRYLLLWL